MGLLNSSNLTNQENNLKYFPHIATLEHQALGDLWIESKHTQYLKVVWFIQEVSSYKKLNFERSKFFYKLSKKY